MKNLIQIAGINDVDEAKMLIECGVDLLGFPLRLEDHKEDITEKEAANIIRSLLPPAQGVLITYLKNAAEIAALCHRLDVTLVQLHGDVSLETLIQLKTIYPELRVVKSLIVGKNNLSALESAVGVFDPIVDALILDTYDPHTGARGATGKTHDWTISRELVELSQRPVLLAGGLTPKNVREAILAVKPAGVDAHTGVEAADGRKNRELVKAFVSEAKEGFAAI